MRPVSPRLPAQQLLLYCSQCSVETVVFRDPADKILYLCHFVTSYQLLDICLSEASELGEKANLLNINIRNKAAEL